MYDVKSPAQVHSKGRLSYSDWFVSSFKMVVGENIFYSSFGHKIPTELETILRKNHFKTIYEPVRINRPSYRVKLGMTGPSPLGARTATQGRNSNYYEIIRKLVMYTCLIYILTQQ